MTDIPGTGGAFLDTQRITMALGLVPGMQTADLGCGSGYFTLALARAVGGSGMVTAVDVRQEPLDEVRAKSEAAGLANIHTVRADLEVLGGTGLGEGTQDVVLLANVLFQSSKKEAMLAEGVRMLKQGGRLIIIDWRKGARGFGPPDAARTAEDDFKRMAEHAGVQFQGMIDAGQFYVGLMFKKTS